MSRARPLADRRTIVVEHGASAVEFAMVAPVLFLFVLGILGFGIIFSQNLALENGARSGARAGIVAGATCADIAAAVARASDALALDGADADVAVSATAGGLDVCPDGADAVVPCEVLGPDASLYVSTTYESGVLAIIPFVNLNDARQLEGHGTYDCEVS